MQGVTRVSISTTIAVLTCFLAGMVSTSCKVRRKGNESRELFFGNSVVPAELTFESEVFIPVAKEDAQDASWRDYVEDGDSYDAAVDAAKGQAKYMQSAFLHHSEHKAMPMTPGGEPVIKILDAEESEKGGFSVVYRATTKLATDKQIFQNGKGTAKIAFSLPVDPEGLYDKNAEHDVNGDLIRQRCTSSPQYPLFMDFFYFWDPAMPGCIADKAKDLVRVRGKATQGESTEKTYPEYEKLMTDRNPDNPVLVTILTGVDHDQVEGDLGVKEFRQIAAYYDSMARSWNGVRPANSPAVVISRNESFHKTYEFRPFKSWGAASLAVRIDVISADQRQPETFFPIAAAGLEKSDIFIYSGHSGLGKNFRISRMEKYLERDLEMPKDKYQIAFFSSCSSWAYYSQMYFDHKKSDDDPEGTLHLDTVSHGLPAFFKDGSPMVTAFVQRLLFSKSPQTWQDIVTWQGNMSRDGNALGMHEVFTIIQGDEDNPTTVPELNW